MQKIAQKIDFEKGNVEDFKTLENFFSKFSEKEKEKFKHLQSLGRKLEGIYKMVIYKSNIPAHHQSSEPEKQRKRPRGSTIGMRTSANSSEILLKGIENEHVELYICNDCIFITKKCSAYRKALKLVSVIHFSTSHWELVERSLVDKNEIIPLFKFVFRTFSPILPFSSFYTVYLKPSPDIIPVGFLLSLFSSFLPLLPLFFPSFLYSSLPFSPSALLFVSWVFHFFIFDVSFSRFSVFKEGIKR